MARPGLTQQRLELQLLPVARAAAGAARLEWPTGGKGPTCAPDVCHPPGEIWPAIEAESQLRGDVNAPSAVPSAPVSSSQALGQALEPPIQCWPPTAVQAERLRAMLRLGPARCIACSYAGKGICVRVHESNGSQGSQPVSPHLPVLLCCCRSGRLPCRRWIAKGLRGRLWGLSRPCFSHWHGQGSSCSASTA